MQTKFKRENVVFLIGNLVFSVGGLFMILSGEWLGWVVFVFFSLGVVVFTAKILPKSWIARLPETNFLRKINESGETQIPDPKLGKLKADENGFSHFKDGNEVKRIVWKQISKISTYKMDLITTDCICLGFELSDGSRMYQIHEEMSGFMDVAGQMQKIFPEIREDWYFTVMTPAFETNLTVLYPRASQN